MCSVLTAIFLYKLQQTARNVQCIRHISIYYIMLHESIHLSLRFYINLGEIQRFTDVSLREKVCLHVTSRYVLLMYGSILDSVQSRTGEHKDVQPKIKLLQYKKRKLTTTHINCLTSFLQKICHLSLHILTDTTGRV